MRDRFGGQPPDNRRRRGLPVCSEFPCLQGHRASVWSRFAVTPRHPTPVDTRRLGRRDFGTVAGKAVGQGRVRAALSTKQMQRDWRTRCCVVLCTVRSAVQEFPPGQASVVEIPKLTQSLGIGYWRSSLRRVVPRADTRQAPPSLRFGHARPRVRVTASNQRVEAIPQEIRNETGPPTRHTEV